jgi:hypothetical protein
MIYLEECGPLEFADFMGVEIRLSGRTDAEGTHAIALCGLPDRELRSTFDDFTKQGQF